MIKKRLSSIFMSIVFLFLYLAPMNVKAETTLIPDPNLEAAIRIQLDLLQKPLEETDLQKLSSLYPKDASKKISSLEGLQYATNLTSLFLPQLGIEQIEPLQSLKKLSFLALNGNKISDIKPLHSLVGIQRLVISGNQIEQIEPLAGLENLTDLLLSNNRVKDISALKGLPLRWLDLSNNQIEDLSPLAHVPSIETLFINHNNIRHIDVLLDLPNLKEVMLDENPLDEQAASILDKLKNKGVSIEPSKKNEQKPQSIRVLLDANPVSFDTAPFISNSTTMVQFRPIFKLLGIQMEWDEETRTITGEKDGVSIKLQIDNPMATVNGNPIRLPEAPMLVDGHTFVPLRFISESVEATVDWEEQSRTAVIKSKRGFTSKDGKFHLTAFGLWNDIADQSEADHLQLAIRSFNHTMLFIYAESKSDNLKNTSLAQYLELTKKNNAITKETITGEKQTKVFGFDALQLTYINNSDWDKRIDTLLVFESGSQFYTIVNSSYEVTYKSSIQDFQKMLESMSFQH